MLVYLCINMCVRSKTELYEMCWNIRDGLRDSLVAAAPYGGPIGTRTLTQSVSSLKAASLTRLFLSSPQRTAQTLPQLSATVGDLFSLWCVHCELPSTYKRTRSPGPGTSCLSAAAQFLTTCLSLSGRAVLWSSWVGRSAMSCCVSKRTDRF